MKRVHTQAKKANRPQNHGAIYGGHSSWSLNALFGKKEHSQSTKNGQNAKRPVVAYSGQELGKQHNVQHKM